MSEDPVALRSLLDAANSHHEVQVKAIADRDAKITELEQHSAALAQQLSDTRLGFERDSKVLSDRIAALESGADESPMRRRDGKDERTTPD